MIDRLVRNHQNADYRESAEQRGKQKHREVTVVPAEIAGRGSADEVAGMIECLIASDLTVEAALLDEAQRDAGDCGHDRSTGDGGCDLRNRDRPKLLREQD